MKGVLKVIYNIVRGLVRIFIGLVVILIAKLIYFFTFEPGKKHQVTERKARRIRALSKFKIFILNILPAGLLSFLGLKNYRDYLNEHLRYGLQLRYNGTDK